MELKQVCTKCGELKDIDSFPKRDAGKRGNCKKCLSSYQVEWAKTHKDQRKVYQKRWNDKNKERIKEVGRIYAAKWREENPDKYKEIHSRKRFKRYGVNAEWYAQQSVKQNELCAICGTSRQWTWTLYRSLPQDG